MLQSLMGQCLQLLMQARIALVNTALTAAGMWTLAIPGIGLLSLFVFICSFIPIAGCFISTVPIAFVALTEYGFLKVRAAKLLLTCKVLHALISNTIGIFPIPSSVEAAMYTRVTVMHVCIGWRLQS